MIHVVARDEAEFQSWFSTSNTRFTYGYVHSAEQINKLTEITGLFIGTCFDRPDIGQILESINEIREFNSKKKILSRDISHLTRYKTTDHSFLNTTSSWSQHNVPIYNTGVAPTLSQGYPNNSMGGPTITSILDEYVMTSPPPSSYKVPLSSLSTASDSMFRLQAARLYSSYITNTFNPLDDVIEYYFTDGNHAVDFAAKYKSVAYEYK